MIWEGWQPGGRFEKSRVDEERKTLKSAVANLVVDNALMRERIRQMEEGKPYLR